MRTLEDLLRPLVLRASVLGVRKATFPLSPVASKFGGAPYFESGEAWPQCQTCKRPHSFICQLDLRETLHPARDRIPFFTFFYCWNCLPWGPPGSDQGEWVVRKYVDPRESKVTYIQPPEQVEHASECHVSFAERLSLPDWEGIQLWCPEASKLSNEVDSEAPWKAYRAAVQKIIGEQEIKSCIGGYPWWIQGEETPDGDSLLAQIDSEHEAGIMWGDIGCVYLFVSKGADPQVSLILQCC